MLDIVTRKFQHLSGGTGSRALDWNHDGELLVVGDQEKTLHIWSKEGRLLKTIEKGDNKTYLAVDGIPRKTLFLQAAIKSGCLIPQESCCKP
jgi:hypothetical protein